jgi:hypothetical protein
MSNANIPLDLSNTKPDFESFVSVLETNLQNRGSWTDILPESTGETLIHYNAAIGTMDQWAIEKAFKEAFISTATNDSSIYASARMLGVRISRKLPGTQKCFLMRINKINSAIISSLVVNEYSQFYINDSVPFFNRTLLNFIDTSNELPSVQLHQGQVLTKTFISSGQPFIQIVLPSLSPFSISDSDVQVYVNNVRWTTIQDGLWRYGIDSKVVEDATLGNGDVILQFGNGINGVIPTAGQEIKIVYVETLGTTQALIANGSAVSSAMPLDGFILEGNVIKDNSISLTNLQINSCEINLSSLTDTIIKAYLPLGYSWNVVCVGLQLDGSPGLGLIVGVSGREATISVVTTFASQVLPQATWTLSIPATGYDEKPSSYYKIMAPSLKRAGNRAVTPADHASIFLSYPGISDVLIRTEKDLHYKTQIAKSANVIAQEILAGDHVSDYYEIVNAPHPSLYSVIWVSLLTQTDTNLTESELTELRAWFSTRQLTGSIIKFQNPEKNWIKLKVDLRCSVQVDPTYVKNKAEVILRAMFKTDKPVLSKRITVSDVYKNLAEGLGTNLDSCSLFFVTAADEVVPLTDAHLIPTDAGLSATGFPTPPGYLALDPNLVINSTTTSR